MKKELLLASALAGTMGLAGVAEAASMSMSGNARNGVEWEDKDSGGEAAMAASRQSSFNVSVSETTDGGIGISTGFALADEGTDEVDPNGITLTFTSGAKLDLIEAGSAYASHLASVPGASGEQGIAGSSGVTAPSGLDYADANDAVGFEFHTAADAMGVDGLKASVSASFNGDAASVSSAHAIENSFSVGASYVTTAGDTSVTIGGGFINADTIASLGGAQTQSSAISVSAVTGSLTVGAGYASGDYINSYGLEANEDVVMKGTTVMTAGAKYVSGDMTFNVGVASGEGKEQVLGGTQEALANTYAATSASVDYAVASGVTATFGYTDVSRENGAKPNGSRYFTISR
jgi:hypothetical protein